MDLSELVSLLTSKGVDYLMSQLPNLIVSKQVSREDAQLILAYVMREDIKALRDEMRIMREDMKTIRDDIKVMRDDIRVLKDDMRSLSDEIRALRGDVKALIEENKIMNSKLDDLRKDITDGIDNLRKDVLDRLDLLNNQLRVLNANIASTYELTSKIMAKLMELGITK